MRKKKNKGTVSVLCDTTQNAEMGHRMPTLNVTVPEPACCSGEEKCSDTRRRTKKLEGSLKYPCLIEVHLYDALLT